MMNFKVLYRSPRCFLLCLCAVIASLNTAVSAEVNDPVAIYQQFYAKSAPGIYEKDSWLFVIAGVPVTSTRQPAIHYEGQAMLQTQARVKAYLLGRVDLSTAKGHGVQGRLGQDIDKLIDSGAFYQFRFDSIPVRVLENRAIEEQYRRVTLINKDSLEKPRIEVSVATEPQSLINYLLRQERSRKNNTLLAQYYFDLGLIREAYFYKIQQLTQKYFLVNYPALDNLPFQSRQYLRKILENDTASYDVRWLTKLPANPELFKQVQAQLDQTDWLGKSTLDLLLLPALLEEKRQQQFVKINRAIEYLVPGAAVRDELDFLQNSKVLRINDITLSNILKASLQQHGFLIIDSSYSGNSNAYFEQAKALFSQGQSIDKVIALLNQSINTSPRHVPSWIYLGSAFKYKKQYLPALGCFQQASILDHNDIESQANIADIYLQLKQFKVAAAYLYYLRQPPFNNQSAYIQKVIHKIQLSKEKNESKIL